MEIDLDTAKRELSFLIQTALGGEEVIILENGQPIIKLVRVSPSVEPGILRRTDEPSSLHRYEQLSVKARRQSGSAKGLISMSEDFDAPLDDFDEYM